MIEELCLVWGIMSYQETIMVLSIRVACRGNYDRFPFEMGFLSREG